MAIASTNKTNKINKGDRIKLKIKILFTQVKNSIR